MTTSIIIYNLLCAQQWSWSGTHTCPIASPPQPSAMTPRRVFIGENLLNIHQCAENYQSVSRSYTCRTYRKQKHVHTKAQHNDLQRVTFHSGVLWAGVVVETMWPPGQKKERSCSLPCERGHMSCTTQFINPVCHPPHNTPQTSSAAAQWKRKVVSVPNK